MLTQTVQVEGSEQFVILFSWVSWVYVSSHFPFINTLSCTHYSEAVKSGCIPLLLLEVNSSPWSTNQHRQRKPWEHKKTLFPDWGIVAHFDNCRGHFGHFVFSLCILYYLYRRVYEKTQVWCSPFAARQQGLLKGMPSPHLTEEASPRWWMQSPLSRSRLYEIENLFQEGPSIIKVCKTNTIERWGKLLLFLSEELSVKQNTGF